MSKTNLIVRSFVAAIVFLSLASPPLEAAPANWIIQTQTLTPGPSARVNCVVRKGLAGSPTATFSYRKIYLSSPAVWELWSSTNTKITDPAAIAACGAWDTGGVGQWETLQGACLDALIAIGAI
jgi:hypothetical protein